MRTLNLAYPETSDIKFEVSKFPDGQQNVSIKPWGQWLNCENDGVEIKSRLNNFMDLELIICATKSLRELGVKDIHLYTPYFMGARSDRKFSVGSNNYLKDVICPIINSLKFESVTVLDPHSNVLEACLNNFKSIDNTELVKFFIRDKELKNNWELMTTSILVSPDAGASHKIYKLADKIGYEEEIITCSKERDVDGKLTKVVVPIKFEHITKDLIIIDDICDGGTTFINISTKIMIKYNKKTPKIYLIVTHGIFSKGISKLNNYFDGIYCTNSYKDLDKDQFGNNFKLVKQLNVF